MPPAASAMTRTTIRAGFIRLTFHMTRRRELAATSTRRPSRIPGRLFGISAGKRQSMVNGAYPNRVNGSLLDRMCTRWRRVRRPPSHADGFHPDGVGIDGKRSGRECDAVWNAGVVAVQALRPLLTGEESGQ